MMEPLMDDQGQVLERSATTYSIISEVDTTATTINNQFLQQAIEDAETTVKQEPADTIATESYDLDVKPPRDLDPTIIKNIIRALGMKKEKVSLPGTSTETEISLQSDAEKRQRMLALSNSTLLRAVLQRKPVSLREPENSPLINFGVRRSSLEASSSSQNIENVDATTGNVIPGPINKRKARWKPLQQKASRVTDAGVVAVVEETDAETENAEEKKEGEETAEGLKVKRVREKPYQCGVCSRWFGCKSHVVEHMRTHTGEKPFKCPVCDKCFSQKSNIQQHMNTHTQKRPFKCHDCGKDFMYRGSLYKHKRLHTGERPYMCGTCERRFTHASQLFEHIRTHTNERPFACGVCQRRFAHSGTMHRHQRNHFKVKDVKVGIMQRKKKKNKDSDDDDVVIIREENSLESQKIVGDINHNLQPYRSREQTSSGGEESSHAQQNTDQCSDEISQGLSEKSVTKLDQSFKQLNQQGRDLHHTSDDDSVTEERASAFKEKNNNSKDEMNTNLQLSVSSVQSSSSSSTPTTKNSDKTIENISAQNKISGQHQQSFRKTSRRKKSGISECGGEVTPISASSALKSVCKQSLPSEVSGSKYPGHCVNSDLPNSSNFVDITSASASTSENAQNRSASLQPSASSSSNPPSQAAEFSPNSSKKTSSKRKSPNSEPGQKPKRTRLETPDLKIYPCDICGHSFCHKRSVKRHKLKCHSEEFAAQISGEGNTGNSGEGKSENSIEQDPGSSTEKTEEASSDGNETRNIDTSLLKSLLSLNANQAPDHTPRGIQPLRAQLLGKASASLQAIAQLCSTQTSTETTLSRTSPTQGSLSQMSPSQGSLSRLSPTQGILSPMSPTQGILSQVSPTRGILSQMSPVQGVFKDAIIADINRNLVKTSDSENVVISSRNIGSENVTTSHHNVFKILHHESDGASGQTIPQIVIKQSHEDFDPNLLRISLKQECEDDINTEQHVSSIDENQNLPRKRKSSVVNQNIPQTCEYDRNQNVPQTSSGLLNNATESFCVKVENCCQHVGEGAEEVSTQTCEYKGRISEENQNMPQTSSGLLNNIADSFCVKVEKHSCEGNSSVSVCSENVEGSCSGEGTTYEILGQVTVKVEPPDTYENL